MYLNVFKCKKIIFHVVSPATKLYLVISIFKIDDHVITYTETLKFLEIIINCRRDWHDNVAKTSCKIA